MANVICPSCEAQMVIMGDWEKEVCDCGYTIKNEECLAREQEQSHECGECGQEWEGDGDSDCPVCNPTDNGREKIKELEIALKLSNSLRADAVSKLRKQREEKLDTDDLTINTLRGLCTKHEKKIKELEKALKDKEPYPSQQHWMAKTERLEKARQKSEERLSVTLSLHTHKMQDIVDLKANIEVLKDTQKMLIYQNDVFRKVLKQVL